jgi:ATP-dependent helicase/DNAse subunit B
MSQDHSFAKENINIQHLPELKFSPTQLKKYVDCPFVFLSEKLFHLSDLPDIDLDVDAMTSGRILHAALQEVLGPGGPRPYTRQAISALLDDIRIKLALPVADERLWPAKKENYIKTIEKFIAFEGDWRKRFPKTVTVGKEIRIAGELALNDDQRIAVTGQIDRIDSISEDAAGGMPQYVVLDYKTSAGSLTNHSGWIKNDDWQLLFYASCIEEGLTNLPAGDVVAAFYFVLSNMSREKGYRILGGTTDLFETETRNKSPLTIEALQKLKHTFKTRMLEIVQNIQSGDFKPKPVEYKLCYECKWNTLCRAPHLN